MARLDLVNEQLRTLEQYRAEESRRATQPDATQIAALTAFKGIGLATAGVLVRELFGWRTFANRRQVGALAGLTPTPYPSGDTT